MCVCTLYTVHEHENEENYCVTSLVKFRCERIREELVELNKERKTMRINN